MIDPSPVRVTLYYGEWQSAYENLDIPNLHLEEGLPTSFNASKRNIVVLDNLIVVFKNPRDVSQMTTLAKQMYLGRVKFVQEAFADATSTPYGYILVNLKQDTPEDLRLRTSILPDDAVQYVYMPKV